MISGVRADQKGFQREQILKTWYTIRYTQKDDNDVYRNRWHVIFLRTDLHTDRPERRKSQMTSVFIRIRLAGTIEPTNIQVFKIYSIFFFFKFSIFI